MFNIAVVDVGTIVVGIGAAIIGAGAVLAGVYLGPQLQGRQEMAQWRRDKLLQFCGDFLAATNEVMDGETMRIAGKTESYHPMPAMTKMDLSHEYIYLLNKGLSVYSGACIDLAGALVRDGESKFADNYADLLVAESKFVAEAHRAILKSGSQSTPPGGPS